MHIGYCWEIQKERDRNEDMRSRGSIAPTFLNSELAGGQRSASRPGRFKSEDTTPGTHWRGLGGPRSRSGRYKMICH
jgi:hypothetical protein